MATRKNCGKKHIFEKWWFYQRLYMCFSSIGTQLPLQRDEDRQAQIDVFFGSNFLENFIRRSNKSISYFHQLWWALFCNTYLQREVGWVGRTSIAQKYLVAMENTCLRGQTSWILYLLRSSWPSFSHASKEEGSLEVSRVSRRTAFVARHCSFLL